MSGTTATFLCFSLSFSLHSFLSKVYTPEMVDCVDIIGVDSYNNDFPKIVTDEDFNRYATLLSPDGWPSGPQAWMDFAKSKGKQFGIAEWAVTNLSGKSSDPADRYAHEQRGVRRWEDHR